MLTREQIFALRDLPQKEVEVPEWNTSVYVRVLNGRERHEFMKLIETDKATAAALVALCVVDENGQRVFSLDDVDALDEKHGAALQTIANAAMRFNGFTADAVDDAKNG